MNTLPIINSLPILSRIIRALANDHRDVVALSGVCRSLRAGVSLILDGPPPLTRELYFRHNNLPITCNCGRHRPFDWYYSLTTVMSKPFTIQHQRICDELCLAEALRRSESKIAEMLEMLRNRASGGPFAHELITDALERLTRTELDSELRSLIHKEFRDQVLRIIQADWERWVAFIQTKNLFT